MDPDVMPLWLISNVWMLMTWLISSCMDPDVMAFWLMSNCVDPDELAH